MKHMKRLASLIMALVMALSLAVPAVAAGNNGVITISNVQEDVTYRIYRLLDLESYNTTEQAYSYKVNETWDEFFETDAAKAYVNVDSNGYVTWKEGVQDSAAADFAKEALAYAKAYEIDPEKTSQNADDFEVSGTSGVFSGLDLGYYLVDSSMGALCSLTTTNPQAYVTPKNSAPSLDKQVYEDGDKQWSNLNTADIGQLVYYRVTIEVHAGAENFIVHDVMSDGLTFDQVTGIVHRDPDTLDKDGEAVSYYLDPKTDYTVDTAPDDSCTFHIVFTETALNRMQTNDRLILYYQATLNENAVIAGTGNPNTAWLEYGEGHTTEEDIVHTYTYGFDLVKTDSQHKLINGAKFKIYDAATGGNEVAVVKVTDKLYCRNYANTTGDIIVVTEGVVRVKGLDNGVYYLQEVAPPQGYNVLTERVKFTISGGNLDAVFDGDNYSSGSGVHVVNKTGTILPETGGMGTTLFYLAGGILVIGAGVALVAKKRMG